jgi:signal transduction histidine kinase
VKVAALGTPVGLVTRGISLLGNQWGRTLFTLIFLWFLVSFALVSGFTSHRRTSDLSRHSAELEQNAEAVAHQFERSLAFLYGAPATLSIDPEVTESVTQGLPKDPAGRPGKRLAASSRLGAAGLNQRLAVASRELGVDIVWAIDANGNCTATSNFDRPESFLGINYADRAYFKSAMAGERGRQYAVGRTTNIPGFFFSAPILAQGRPVGAVVAKIDVTRLSQWFKRFDCFITDESGVIILSSDPRLEHHALSGSAVFQTAPLDLEKKYKRRDFSSLPVGHVDPRLPSYGSAIFPGLQTPVMVASRRLEADTYTIYTYTQVPEVERQGSITGGLLALVFTAGAGVIILIYGFSNYLHHMHEAMIASEAASRSKGEFLATMSHEIRTPMNGIIGLARMIQDTPLTGEQASYMGSLSHSADNLLRILNDILDFSKIEAGKIELESVPFSLRDRLQATVQAFRGKAEEQGVLLELEVAEDIPAHLQGDPGRLCQVLNNLLGNALKFTHKGQVALVCRLLERSGASVTVNFAVRDSGIGIAPRELSRIFEKFTQADSSTTRLYGGTGLGLAISTRLTELMGGQLQVESTVGVGSVFSFTLPFGIPLQETVTLAQAPASVYLATRELRVLVVDDLPINQLVAKKTIARTGNHQITCACNGEEAVDLWTRNDYDLIFMDVQMPVMDGLEATRMIRSREDMPRERVPICAMTANAMKEDRLICEEAGMDFYLAKPILAEDVYGIIRRIAQA